MLAKATKGTAVVTLPSDTEILITREFNASRRLVYRAWTTPELVRRWWSGGLGEMTVAEIDLRVGGRWRYAMLTPDGTEVAFHGEYRELVPDERIVTTEVFETPGMEPSDADAPVNVITFAERNGRTTLSLLVRTSSRELRDMIVGSGMETGTQSGWDLLEEIAVSLEDESSQSDL